MQYGGGLGNGSGSQYAGGGFGKVGAGLLHELRRLGFGTAVQWTPKAETAAAEQRRQGYGPGRRWSGACRDGGIAGGV